jgi:hypothetical protein
MLASDLIVPIQINSNMPDSLRSIIGFLNVIIRLGPRGLYDAE